MSQVMKTLQEQELTIAELRRQRDAAIEVAQQWEALVCGLPVIELTTADIEARS